MCENIGFLIGGGVALLVAGCLFIYARIIINREKSRQEKLGTICPTGYLKKRSIFRQIIT